MFQPEPTPFAAAYFPSSPYSYSYSSSYSHSHSHSPQAQSSSDASPAGGSLPLDPTAFDFGYRIASTPVTGGGAGVTSGSGSASASASAVPGAGFGGSGKEIAGSSSRPLGIGPLVRQLGIPSNCSATGPELETVRPPSATRSIQAGHPHHLTHNSHRTASSSSTLPYGTYSATSPSSTASPSSSSPSHSTSPSSSVTAASPYSSHHSPTVSHRHQLPLRNQSRAQQQGVHCHIHPHSPLVKMENQQQDSEHDQHGIAAQQAAAKDYQPDYEGAAVVGGLTPSNVIVQEYAKADPIYVEKTANLPQQFSHYRPIRGDGNCGWTAIGYSYFEKLVDHGNGALIQREIERLTQFNNTCIAADQNFGGYWEDFADAFINLLTEVGKSIDSSSTAIYLVQQRWNDTETSNYLLFYLRLLTSVHLRMNAADYDAFVADSGGIIGYTASNVDMPNKEIEHIGISAIVDVLLKPVNLSVEIAYLDLSPGSATNVYRFPNDNSGQDAASMTDHIYLLYRPTHYDVLYRTPPVHTLSGAGQISNPFSVQVHRVRFTDTAAIASTQGGLDMYGNVDYETLAMIPGFGGSAMSMLGPALGPAPSMSESFSPTPQNTAWSQFTNPFGPGSEPSNQILTPERVPSVISATPVPAAVDLMPSQRKLSQPSPEPRPRPVERTASGSSLGGGGVSIRFSPLQFQYDEGKERFPDMTFQVTTNTFKNSVWNRAHFGNPDFHPEEWSPEDENIDGRLACRKKSR